MFMFKLIDNIIHLIIQGVNGTEKYLAFQVKVNYIIASDMGFDLATVC